MASQPCKATPYLLPCPPVCMHTNIRRHTHTHDAQPPSHLALLPYTQSSQAYQVCLCCCCWANEQCTKTKDQAKLLLSDPLWREGREGREGRRGGEQGKETEMQRWLTKVSLCFVKIYSYSHVRNRCRVLGELIHIMVCVHAKATLSLRAPQEHVSFLRHTKSYQANIFSWALLDRGHLEQEAGDWKGKCVWEGAGGGTVSCRCVSSNPPLPPLTNRD